MAFCRQESDMEGFRNGTGFAIPPNTGRHGARAAIEHIPAQCPVHVNPISEQSQPTEDAEHHEAAEAKPKEPFGDISSSGNDQTDTNDGKYEGSGSSAHDTEAALKPCLPTRLKFK